MQKPKQKPQAKATQTVSCSTKVGAMWMTAHSKRKTNPGISSHIGDKKCVVHLKGQVHGQIWFKKEGDTMQQRWNKISQTCTLYTVKLKTIYKTSSIK